MSYVSYLFGGKSFLGGTTSPTAKLHIGGGTATAGTAPLKLTSGTALTIPEDGALEYHASHLYFTINSTRYQLDQQAAISGLTINRLTKATSSTTIGDSQITDNGTEIRFLAAGLLFDDNGGGNSRIIPLNGQVIFQANGNTGTQYSFYNGISSSFTSGSLLDINANTINSSSGSVSALRVFGTAFQNTGSQTIRWVDIAPTYQQSGSPTGVMHGIYYNPTITSLITPHIAFENTTGDVILGSTSGIVSAGSLKTGGTAPTTSGTTKMVISDANGLLSFTAIPSGGSGSPAGSDTQIQYNSSGSFDASSLFVVDTTNKRLKTTTTSGADTGFLAFNSGTGSTDTAAYKLDNNVDTATLFITNAANSLVRSTGFFTGSTNGFVIYPNAKQALRCLDTKSYFYGDGDTGVVGIGVSSPTAVLHIKAGSASANSAPLKLTSGTALTTPEDGALEYHTSHLYFTIGSTRFQLDQQSGTSTTMGTFGSTPNSNGGSISSNVLTLQPANGSNPGGVSTTTQTFAGAKTFSGNITVPHIISSGSTPSIAAFSGAGTSPTVSVAGTDIAGTISVITGTSPTAGQIIVEITWAAAFTNPPIVIVCPAHQTLNSATVYPVVFVSNSSSTSFTIYTNNVSGLAGSNTYKWNYMVMGV